jgi:hypothetical protein
MVGCTSRQNRLHTEWDCFYRTAGTWLRFSNDGERSISPTEYYHPPSFYESEAQKYLAKTYADLDPSGFSMLALSVRYGSDLTAEERNQVLVEFTKPSSRRTGLGGPADELVQVLMSADGKLLEIGRILMTKPIHYEVAEQHGPAGAGQ